MPFHFGAFKKAANDSRFSAAQFSAPVGAPLTNKVLTAKARNKLPSKAFALPGGKYPINDEAHARNALARVSQYGTASEKAKVRAAVHHKFPGIGG